MSGAADPANDVRPPRGGAARRIADEIRRRIAVGELQPGDALATAPELQAEFGVSLPTLREGLRILEAEGLLSGGRGAPAKVRTPSRASAAASIGMLLQLARVSLRDLYQARCLLEPPLIAQLASTRSDADLIALRAHLELEAADVDDFERFAGHTAALHRLLIERCPNQTLSLLGGLLDDLFERHVRQSVARQTARFDYAALNRRAVANHTRLVDLIAARAPQEAAAVWSAHLEQVRDVIFPDDGEETVVDLYR